MNSQDALTTAREPAANEDGSQSVAGNEAGEEDKHQDARAPARDRRIERAEARTQLAEQRTKEAETRSDQAIRDSELRYRRLFEAAKDGVLILDVDTGRISDVNPFLFKLLGFSRDEMIGRTVGELSPFKDIESNQAMLERLQNH